MKLLTVSFVSFMLLFHLIILLHQNKNSPITAMAINQVTQTCQKCAEKSPLLDYNFCVNSLEPIEGSETSDEQGLAIISLELAIVNATRTVSNIQTMLETRKFEDRGNIEGCLQDCLDLYSDAIYVMNDTIAAFKSKEYASANILTSGAMESSDTCENGFKEQGGVSPLTMDNYYLSQMCDIALVISNLLSQQSPQNSSMAA